VIESVVNGKNPMQISLAGVAAFGTGFNHRDIEGREAGEAGGSSALGRFDNSWTLASLILVRDRSVVFKPRSSL
jgi:hypothetical protein